MAMGLEERPKVGRKKRERPARTCRMDADLISMADAIAKREGIPVGTYLSDLFRSRIEREYAKLVGWSARKAGEEED